MIECYRSESHNQTKMPSSSSFSPKCLSFIIAIASSTCLTDWFRIDISCFRLIIYQIIILPYSMKIKQYFCGEKSLKLKKMISMHNIGGVCKTVSCHYKFVEIDKRYTFWLFEGCHRNPHKKLWYGNLGLKFKENKGIIFNFLFWWVFFSSGKKLIPCI